MGQIYVQSSLEPFVIETERTDPTVTSFAGVPLGIEAWTALGLREASAELVKLKERLKGLPEAGWTELLVMLRLAGGRTPQDLRAFKEDSGLLRVWDLPEQASPRAVYQFLERKTLAIPAGSRRACLSCLRASPERLELCPLTVLDRGRTSPRSVALPGTSDPRRIDEGLHGLPASSPRTLTARATTEPSSGQPGRGSAALRAPALVPPLTLRLPQAPEDLRAEAEHLQARSCSSSRTAADRLPCT